MNITEILKHYPEISSIHPVAELFPLPTDDELKLLIDDIGKNGLMNDIILSENDELIDGRSRLFACYKAHVEARFKKTSADPFIVSISANLSRRHLTIGQKAAVGDKAMAYFTAQAKARQATSTGGVAPQLMENFPQADQGTARDKAGAALGISGKSIDNYRAIKESIPELADKVAKGEKTLNSAYKEAKNAIKSKKSHATPVEVKAKLKDVAYIVTVDGKRKEIPAPKKPVFNRTNNNVDWALWTWNPVTGCNHGCAFCYAREIAHQRTMEPYYPFKFEPTFHEYRLTAPSNTKPPKSDDPRDRRVFVCSMADLFGKWVPEKWITCVFEACLSAPEWEYLFLTKWPNRYAQHPLLERAWYGASIIQQVDVARVTKAMQSFEGKDIVKWLSLEPLLTPLDLGDLSWCDLLVIGSQTSTQQPTGFVPALQADFEWIVDIVNQARAYGVPYYIKPNAGLDQPGMKLPKMSPRRIR